MRIPPNETEIMSVIGVNLNRDTIIQSNPTMFSIPASVMALLSIWVLLFIGFATLLLDEERHDSLRRSRTVCLVLDRLNNPRAP